MRNTTMVVAAAIAATLAAPVVLADDAVAASEAMRVVRDAETGELRKPTNDELKQMLEAEKAARKAKGQAEPSANPQPVQVRSYSGGMKAAVLGPEFLVSLEARRDADGKLVVTHSRSEYDGHAERAAELPTE
jgi:hypothetical protein